jgi:signal transduction histidine kinase
MKLWQNKKYIIAVFLLASYAFLTSCSINTKATNIQPTAQKGYLDLSGWNFDEDRTIKLDGEWEFYWNKLLSPKDLTTPGTQTPDTFARVPAAWTDIQGIKTTPLGAATYRLTVKLPLNHGILAIRVNSIRMSNRIFIGGVEVGSSGSPGYSIDTYTVNNTPYVTVIPAEKDTVDIVVQVADYDYKAGGIVSSISMGNRSDIFSKSYSSGMIRTFVAACLCVTGLYYLLVYLGRRTNISALYFGLYAVLVSGFVMMYGDKLILQVFPDLQFRPMFRLQNMFLQSSLIFVSLFVREMTGKLLPKWFVPGIIAVAGGYSAAYWVLPLAVVTSVETPMLLLGFLVYAMICVFLGRAVFRRQTGKLSLRASVQLLIAFVCILVVFVSGMLVVDGILVSDILGALGFVGFVGFITAILSRQYNDAFRTIEQMNNELLSLDKLKDAFLANTSHELRTPLNGIINLTQSVINQVGERLELTQQQDLKLVVSAGRQLSNLINDILDMSSLKSGEIKLRLKPVDVGAVVSSVFHIMGNLKQGASVQLINSISGKLPLVEADEDRIRQIYYNLIGNALKFTEEGSVEVGARQSGDILELWVEDTGCGIPPDKRENVFKAFYQVESGESKVTQGTGLGLSITKQLVELHGGHITVQSALNGKGTRFTFTVPISKKQRTFDIAEIKNDDADAISLTAAPRIEGERTDGKCSVLVAEDDALSLRALLSILDSKDCYIKAVHDGQQALDEIEKQPNYDLVILDIMMPRVSGFQVLKRMRERFSPIDLPILMLTAKARQEDIKAGFEAGANDYIAKPFEAEELKARVATLLQMKRSVSALVSTELSFLQAQIKPHFLYNALSVISSLSVRDPKRAKELLLHLSDYLRGSFNFENHNGLISLSSELQTVEAYLAIEQERFKERLRVEYDIDESIAVSIPILSIQPLVENAVRHGIMGKIEGGTIKVAVYKRLDKICIDVEDNGLGIEEDRLPVLLQSDGKPGVGLRNVHKRVLALYGEGLHIESKKGHGTRVTMVIPVIAVQ